MMKEVGLWIDHERAVIVSVENETNEIKVINANIAEHPRQSGVSTPADDLRQRVLTKDLNRYYDEVIAYIAEAKALFIFGPGEAKGELNKRLEKKKYGGRILGIEPADTMTEPQIAQKIRDRFHEKRTKAHS